MRTWFTLGVVLGGLGCEQVKRLPIETREIPVAVQEVLEESCDCHVTGNETTFDKNGLFIAPPIVVPGEPEMSELIIRIEDGSMPIDGRILTEAGRFVLWGWIAAGAELVDAEGGSEGGSEETTSDPSEDPCDAEVPEHDAFVDVLEIFQNRCGGTACHRDGGPIAPALCDALAFESITNGVSRVEMEPYAVPMDPDASHLVLRLEGTQPQTMPPPPEGPIPASEIETIRAWIADGAEL